MTEKPKQGDVWDYPYLWAWQAEHGETEGRKPRPCAVAILLQRQSGQTGVVFLAITSQKPDSDRRSLEIPETERKRAGLTEDMPLWVILDEHNHDIVETSYYLEPGGYIGTFSQRFVAQVQAAFLKSIKEHHSISVRRTE